MVDLPPLATRELLEVEEFEHLSQLLPMIYSPLPAAGSSLLQSVHMSKAPYELGTPVHRPLTTDSVKRRRTIFESKG